MPAPIKPASDPAWIIGNEANGIEPSPSEKMAGYDVNQRPTKKKFNWVFYNFTLWVRWLVFAVQNRNEFDACIGVGGDYDDINAAMADVGLPANPNLLIISSLALAAPQVITKNNTSITLKSGVVLSDAGALTGIQISATRVRIKGGAMIGFATQAILVDLASISAIIGEMIFKTNAADLTDNSGAVSTYGVVNE